MPQTNADRLLNRITALHKSLQLDEGGHVSKMERDLMLNYLREFYEIYASGTIAPPAAKASPETIVETPKPSAAPPPPPTPAAPPEPAGPPASVVAPPAVSVPPTPPRPASDSSFSQPAETAPAEYRAPEPPPAPAPEPRARLPTGTCYAAHPGRAAADARGAFRAHTATRRAGLYIADGYGTN